MNTMSVWGYMKTQDVLSKKQQQQPYIHTGVVILLNFGTVREPNYLKYVHVYLEEYCICPLKAKQSHPEDYVSLQ